MFYTEFSNHINLVLSFDFSIRFIHFDQQGVGLENQNLFVFNFSHNNSLIPSNLYWNLRLLWHFDYFDLSIDHNHPKTGIFSSLTFFDSNL